MKKLNNNNKSQVKLFLKYHETSCIKLDRVFFSMGDNFPHNSYKHSLKLHCKGEPYRLVKAVATDKQNVTFIYRIAVMPSMLFGGVYFFKEEEDTQQENIYMNL